jgi:hypothetical protein
MVHSVAGRHDFGQHKLRVAAMNGKPDRPALIAQIWAQAAHDLRQPVQAA